MRLFSGIQPTGKMHLGNYMGAVSNWVELQTKYDSFFTIADLHSLTTVYENPAQLREDKLNLAIDLLSAGIDPEKAALFVQSDVPEHCELHLIFSMITPLPWLTRIPSYKSKIEEIKEKDLNTYGFLGYPVLQAADILLYRTEIVPVGYDQLPHLELAREIARRFNHLYQPLFPEPKDSLTQYPTLPGTDGRKMSKSYGNTIPVSDPAEAVEYKVKNMLTDPGRKRRSDPGNPEICPVYDLHKVFNTPEGVSAIAVDCRSAAIGCIDCKKNCAAKINEKLAHFRELRSTLEMHPTRVKDILAHGAEKARRIAKVTLAEVKSAVGL